ncbi:MAG: Rieske 2Fe-2S domain-containing protein [Ignavibacteriales bacterium]|nr:Rieske 2Fe-2S domain-containing protein [Ignavibacteriales bacterium]
MDRKDFIVNLGKGAAFVCASCYLASCYDDASNPVSAPQNVDFTIDISQSPYTALQNTGGSAYKDGIIIARISSASLTALSQACTHQGTTVQYEHSNSRMHCPLHGSNYKTDGAVINGPATRPLQKYNTSLNGAMLRVFS